jgi:hypothetical protein
MYLVHKAGPDDLDFLLEIDTLGEGYSSVDFDQTSPEELAQRRRMMDSFIQPLPDTGDTEFEKSPKYALIVKDGEGNRLGLLMFLIRDMNQPSFQHFDIYESVVRVSPGEDGRVARYSGLGPTGHRRQQIATISTVAEETARQLGVSMIYTIRGSQSACRRYLREEGLSADSTSPLWMNRQGKLVKDIPPEAAA